MGYPKATVVSIGDGDTFRILLNGVKKTIRLALIDTPELNQFGGQEARSRLKELLVAGSTVSLKISSQDKYGRLVAEVFQNRKSIGLQLVKEGFAVIYRKYFKTTIWKIKRYGTAEADAKRKKLGFWNQTPVVMPWEFRRVR